MHKQNEQAAVTICYRVSMKRGKHIDEMIIFIFLILPPTTEFIRACVKLPLHLSIFSGIFLFLHTETHSMDQEMHQSYFLHSHIFYLQHIHTYIHICTFFIFYTVEFYLAFEEDFQFTFYMPLPSFLSMNASMSGTQFNNMHFILTKWMFAVMFIFFCKPCPVKFFWVQIICQKKKNKKKMRIIQSHNKIDI